jgi:hypothetical protein
MEVVMYKHIPIASDGSELAERAAVQGGHGLASRFSAALAGLVAFALGNLGREKSAQRYRDEGELRSLRAELLPAGIMEVGVHRR